mgnify:CR=1 FL=1
MQRHPVRHFSQSALFLMELILAAAFLSLSSVVCIRLYLYAHTLSAASLAKTQAVRESQNIGSSWLSSDGSLADTLSLYLETTNPVEDRMVPEEADSLVLYYNSDWELLPSSQDAAFCMELSLKNSGTGISTLLLSASEWKDNAPQTSCYSIEFKRYDAASVKTAPKDSDHV